MDVLGVQFNIVWEDKAANFNQVKNMLSHATVEAGGLIVLPEMFATGFSMNVESIYEDPGGETEQFLSQLAQEHNAYILGGKVAKASDGRGLNQALLYAPSGLQILKYSKMHPFSYAGETNFYGRGDDIQHYQINDFHIAPFVCYDLRFPEIFRHAVQLGAQLFLVIACWPQPRQEHWLALLKARAIENQCYVVGVNRVGNDPNVSYSGRSQIISPKGEILADAGEDEGLLHHELNLESLLEYRKSFPALNDIHPRYQLNK